MSIGSPESRFFVRSEWKASIPKSHAMEKSLLTAVVAAGALLFTADQLDAGVSDCSDGVLGRGLFDEVGAAVAAL